MRGNQAFSGNALTGNKHQKNYSGFEEIAQQLIQSAMQSKDITIKNRLDVIADNQQHARIKNYQLMQLCNETSVILDL